MDEVVEVHNVENVCRLCLTVDCPKSSIFGDQGSAATPLVAKIQGCLSIQVTSSDKLSTLICADCVKSVNQWHAFKESCLHSQEKLNQWLANQMQQTPMVVTIKEEPMDLDFCENNVEVLLSENEESESASIRSTHTQEEAEKSMENQVEVVNDDDVLNVDKDKDLLMDSSAATKETDESSKVNCPVAVKSEPQEDDTDCTIEIESVTGSELLLNPMAILSGKEDRVMEADSTQKSGKATLVTKKKFRRGPHTHYRGIRIFKQKCKICRFNLHSKTSYLKHMQRFHSDKKCDLENSETLSQEEEETIEDLEDELISMEKDSPLTQVQQNIISQLKTFCCYSCNQTFGDRRSTLNHIRQHMPDLRPYTCIACLTEFPDRSIYKLHCGASFECAMKIALVVPRHGVEKYFTCNMCLRPMSNRKELLSHLYKHSDKQYEEMTSPSRSPPKLQPMTSLSPVPQENPVKNMAGPYKGGDPAHNHTCDLCGMIYRYKPNMYKHRELCSQLQPETRTSYRCVHCGMTFLVFKKFHSHITTEHKKKEFTCSQCKLKFRSPSDYLTHHEEHRFVNNDKEAKTDGSGDATPRGQLDIPGKEEWQQGGQKYSCALCGQEFSTRTELSEHRNLHLKVKIYSCVICRSMFSSPGALEIHMKDHGIEDPSERNANSSCVEYGQTDREFQDAKSAANVSTVSDPGIVGRSPNECGTCGKGFSNTANLKRHIRNAHEAKIMIPCSKCSRSFRTQELHDQHQSTEHRRVRGSFECPNCPKVFSFEANLKLHRENAHGSTKTNHQCDLCGKGFIEESSLKIHRSWHSRANSRLSIIEPIVETKLLPERAFSSTPKNNSEKPARARKSFPNRVSNQQQQQQSQRQSQRQSQGNLQCQVCDDRFADVMDLRTHLWDVHCAKNKPEKSFTGDELQCELCTNVFPDQETLKLHMEWHKAHPILGEVKSRNFPCDVCGKMYSSKKVLARHKKLHKANTVAAMKFQSLAKKPSNNQHFCTICRKIFCSQQSLQRHRMNVHRDLSGIKQQPSPIRNGSRASSIDESKSKKIKVELDEAQSTSGANAANTGKKSVTCSLCRKIFASMSVLYKHKHAAHKTRWGKAHPKPKVDSQLNQGKVSCSTCGKQFKAATHLRQHIRLKHKHAKKYMCSVPGCTKGYPTTMTLQNHEMAHRHMQFPCSFEGCDRVFTMLSCQKNHEASQHKNDSRWKCSYRGCNMVLTSTALLKSHEAQHRVELSAKCSYPECTASFASAAALKVHLATHRSSGKWRCTVPGCDMTLPTTLALKNHELSHSSMIYSCNLCDKHFFSSEYMTSHMTSVHNTTYEATGKKTFHRETDLNTYVVPGATDATCPGCSVRYPNYKAMKIHYFKFHETAD